MSVTEAPRTDRSSGISYQELLRTDTRPVPLVLRTEAPSWAS